MAQTIEKKPFGRMPDGTEVDLYTLTNRHQMAVGILTYGGSVQQIHVPDRDGKLANVALGFDQLDDYVNKARHFGAIVGRYGNRIGGASFTLDGETFRLAANNGPNSLHGGREGFDRKVWRAEAVENGGRAGVALRYTSPDGEEGYPGTLAVKVVYLLTDNNELCIDYAATTDRPTVLNLTNHTYFNLAGEGSGSVYGHELKIDASAYTPVGATLIPNGEIAMVAGTPFDFTTPTAIGARIRESGPQLVRGHGYDHNFVLDKPRAGELTRAARVVEPTSGRVMEVQTTEPGMQFYTGNFLELDADRHEPQDVSPVGRLLPGDPTLSRFAEPAGLSVDGAAAWRGVPLDHDLPLRDGKALRAGQGATDSGLPPGWLLSRRTWPQRAGPSARPTSPAPR